MEGQDLVHYQPTLTKVATVAKGGVALVAILTYVKWTHGYWLGWPPASGLHVIGMVVLAFLPLTLLTLGRSYALDGNDFTELHFGRELRRFPLASYGGTSTRFGGLRLHFGNQRVRLHATAEASRQHFLNALQERASAARGGMPLSRITAEGRQEGALGVPIDHDAVRVPFARLRWGITCIACDQPATTKVELTAKRGFDLVVVRRYEILTTKAAVCDVHAKNRRHAMYALYVSVLLMPAVLGGALALVLERGTVIGALLVGTLLTAFLAAPWLSFLGGDRMDWWIFGTRIKDPSPDLTTVIVQTRHPRVLHTAMQPGAEVAAINAGATSHITG